MKDSERRKHYEAIMKQRKESEPLMRSMENLRKKDIQEKRKRLDEMETEIDETLSNGFWN